jgi:uncharacterized protein
MNKLIQKLDYHPFKPAIMCSSGKGQTLMTSFYPAGFDISPTKTHHLTLPDQDKLVIMEYKPKNWQPGNRIVVLVHGLTGSYKSKYNVRLTKEWLKTGHLVIRMNLRGCGPGAGLARNPYHSGRSEDTRFVVQWLANRYPSSPVTQVGFSLGGNITLKMAAEDSENPTGNLDSVIAISPPVDLHACSALLHKPENRIFEKYFVSELIEDVKLRKKHFPDIPDLELDPLMPLLSFDNTYTAPFSGFVDAIDYYTQCSSGMLLDRIKIPTFILYAKDDPFITIERFIHKMNPDIVDCLVTERGGHVAWFGSPIRGSSRLWMDGALIRWLEWFESQNTSKLKAV